MINFLLARIHGLPCPNQLAQLPALEREVAVTEDVLLERDRLYNDLSCLTVDELAELYAREVRNIEDEADAYRSRLSDSQLEFWLHKDGWLLEEALALTFGCKPTASLVAWSQANKHLNDWAAEVIIAHDLILRALSMKMLTNPIAPQYFISWASSKPFQLPEIISKGIPSNQDLIGKITSVEVENEHLKTEVAELKAQLNKSEWPKYIQPLQMFGAVCRGVYGFDRLKERNPATRKIAEAIEKYTDIIKEVNENSRDRFVRRRIQDAINALPQDHRIQIALEGTSDSE